MEDPLHETAEQNPGRAERARVAIFGAGQLATNVATTLRGRGAVDVLGPFGRTQRKEALTSGADVVVIATTSFLRDVAPDVRLAVESGSNVITSAEEAAYPWVIDESLARELDEVARSRGVTVVGAGLNPGFAFDALVVTATGPSARVDSIRVQRIVDLSGFGETVLRRIGIGFTELEFAAGTAAGSITGHIGFPQSMRIVARALGLSIEGIEREISPIFAEAKHKAGAVVIDVGATAGFEQRYLAQVSGRLWFEAQFTGHVALTAIGVEPRDEIWIDGDPPLHFEISPGLNAQSGSAALVANSIRRIIDADPGWLTVADLVPASPR